jgi:hypothetical protein
VIGDRRIPHRNPADREAQPGAARVGLAGRCAPGRPLRPAALETARLSDALAGVAKHAGAIRAGLTLSHTDHEVAIDVRDDGQGFDPGRLTGKFSATNPLPPARLLAWLASPGPRPGMTSAPATLLIADDHPVVRGGLRGTFAADPGFEVLGEAAWRRSGSPTPSGPT